MSRCCNLLLHELMLKWHNPVENTQNMTEPGKPTMKQHSQNHLHSKSSSHVKCVSICINADSFKFGDVLSFLYPLQVSDWKFVLLFVPADDICACSARVRIFVSEVPARVSVHYGLVCVALWRMMEVNCSVVLQTAADVTTLVQEVEAALKILQKQVWYLLSNAFLDLKTTNRCMFYSYITP